MNAPIARLERGQGLTVNPADQLANGGAVLGDSIAMGKHKDSCQCE